MGRSYAFSHQIFSTRINKNSEPPFAKRTRPMQTHIGRSPTLTIRGPRRSHSSATPSNRHAKATSTASTPTFSGNSSCSIAKVVMPWQRAQQAAA